VVRLIRVSRFVCRLYVSFVCVVFRVSCLRGCLWCVLRVCRCGVCLCVVVCICVCLLCVCLYFVLCCVCVVLCVV